MSCQVLCPWDSPGKNTGMGCHFLLLSAGRCGPNRLQLHHRSASQLLGTICLSYQRCRFIVDSTIPTLDYTHVICLWFQIGKGVGQGCILSPCLFNFYAEYIMRNAGLEETQAGIKIARRNINNLRYADDTTLVAESEEELKSLLRKVKEESETVGLKLNIRKCRSWHWSLHFMGSRWGNSGNSIRLYFSGLQNHCRL